MQGHSCKGHRMVNTGRNDVKAQLRYSLSGKWLFQLLCG